MAAKYIPVLFVIYLSAFLYADPPAVTRTSETHEKTIERIMQAALHDSAAYNRLAELCDRFGPRISGSDNLEKAIDWIIAEMHKDGLDNAHGESAMVPHWVRGKESLTLIEPWEMAFPLLGLGRSIGTPEKGITAQVLAVENFEELERRKAEVPGKIVVYDAPFTSYGKTVAYRYSGAIEAARYGAVASLIRSVTPFSLNTPHTGGMAYSDTVPQIPQAAITVEAAAMLHRMTQRGQKPKLHLIMEGKMLPDVESRNVVVELRGSEKPDEIIVFGGHSDSWDVGQGAMDDAGGCVAAWEALRLIQSLGIQPKRTLRVVLWTNEEYGLRGGWAYAEAHKDDNHLVAIESDGGVFAPRGFGFTGPDTMREKLANLIAALEPIGANQLFDNGEEADISPLMISGVPGMSLKVDNSKYFWYHHTAADAVSMIDRDEFNRCVAALATMVYSISELY